MSEIKHLTIGEQRAPITVESFINFACPYCKITLKLLTRLYKI